VRIQLTDEDVQIADKRSMIVGGGSGENGIERRESRRYEIGCKRGKEGVESNGEEEDDLDIADMWDLAVKESAWCQVGQAQQVQCKVGSGA